MIDELELKWNWSLKKFTKKNLETVTNENDIEMAKEIPKGKYISSEERQKIIDNLRSIIIV